ncbi:hypothetical protein Hanom_Chr08g00707051 [Helianthus anomalus]
MGYGGRSLPVPVRPRCCTPPPGSVAALKSSARRWRRGLLIGCLLIGGPHKFDLSLSLSLSLQSTSKSAQGTTLLGSHCFPSTPLGSPQGDGPPPSLSWRLHGRWSLWGLSSPYPLF